MAFATEVAITIATVILLPANGKTVRFCVVIENGSGWADVDCDGKRDGGRVTTAQCLAKLREVAQRDLPGLDYAMPPGADEEPERYAGEIRLREAVRQCEKIDRLTREPKQESTGALQWASTLRR